MPVEMTMVFQHMGVHWSGLYALWNASCFIQYPAQQIGPDTCVAVGWLSMESQCHSARPTSDSHGCIGGVGLDSCCFHTGKLQERIHDRNSTASGEDGQQETGWMWWMEEVNQVRGTGREKFLLRPS